MSAAAAAWEPHHEKTHRRFAAATRPSSRHGSARSAGSRCWPPSMTISATNLKSFWLPSDPARDRHGGLVQSSSARQDRRRGPKFAAPKSVSGRRFAVRGVSHGNLARALRALSARSWGTRKYAQSGPVSVEIDQRRSLFRIPQLVLTASHLWAGASFCRRPVNLDWTFYLRATYLAACRNDPGQKSV